MQINQKFFLFLVLLGTTFLFGKTNNLENLKFLCKKESLSNVVFNLNNRYQILNAVDKKIERSAIDKDNKLVIKFILNYSNIDKLNVKKTIKSFSNYCKNYKSSLEFKCLTIYNKIPVIREMIIVYNKNKKILILDYNSNCKLIDKKIVEKN